MVVFLQGQCHILTKRGLFYPLATFYWTKKDKMVSGTDGQKGVWRNDLTPTFIDLISKFIPRCTFWLMNRLAWFCHHLSNSRCTREISKRKSKHVVVCCYHVSPMALDRTLLAGHPQPNLLARQLTRPQTVTQGVVNQKFIAGRRLAPVLPLQPNLWHLTFTSTRLLQTYDWLDCFQDQSF